MKRILKILVPLVLILCAGAYAFIPGVQSLAQPPFVFSKNVSGSHVPMSKSEARNLRQIVAADNAKARTIMWQSDAAENRALVEYRVKGSEQISSVSATNEQFTDDKITNYLHAVTLTNLTPNTKYEYRVGYADKRSEWHDLKTAGPGSFKAIIFPDSQSNDYRGWEKLAQSAGKANPDAAFFVNMGDLVDNGEDHTQWRAWFDSLNGLIDKIPVAPLLGNHETYDLNWKIRMPIAYLNLFSLPANGSQERKNQYYSYDYGDVHFIVLNTQMAEMEQFQPGLLGAQTEWFKKDIAKTDKKWKVVLMHKDVLVYGFKNKEGRQAGISDIGRAFMPLFDQYGVDIVLTAHLHTYRNRGHIYNFERDERGPLYILTGVAGNVRYPELWADHPLDVAVAPQPETDNYMTFEASGDTLRLASFLSDGKQIDKVEIKK